MAGAPAYDLLDNRATILEVFNHIGNAAAAQPLMLLQAFAKVFKINDTTFLDAPAALSYTINRVQPVALVRANVVNGLFRFEVALAMAFRGEMSSQGAKVAAYARGAAGDVQACFPGGVIGAYPNNFHANLVTVEAATRAFEHIFSFVSAAGEIVTPLPALMGKASFFRYVLDFMRVKNLRLFLDGIHYLKVAYQHPALARLSAQKAIAVKVMTELASSNIEPRFAGFSEGGRHAAGLAKSCTLACALGLAASMAQQKSSSDAIIGVLTTRYDANFSTAQKLAILEIVNSGRSSVVVAFKNLQKFAIKQQGAGRLQKMWARMLGGGGGVDGDEGGGGDGGDESDAKELPPEADGPSNSGMDEDFNAMFGDERGERDNEDAPARKIRNTGNRAAAAGEGS